MLWICRAGKNAEHFEYYKSTSKIYLPWQGFCIDMSSCKGIQDFRKVVESEKGTENRTSISNWASQLRIFCETMNVDDYVLIPHEKSRKYTLSKIVGEYTFDGFNEKGLWHSRCVNIIKTEIPREIFPQSIQYTLGAFRTAFKVRQEKDILDIIEKYKD